MSQYRRYDVKQLVDEAKKKSDVLTIEATVVTGFESAAMDECKEKCSPLIIYKAQGRIYFNILCDNFDKVLKLRSVDNLFLVNDALGSIELSKKKEEDIEIIKSLVHQVNWERTLHIWSKLLNFEGILFPMNNINTIQNEDFSIKENDALINTSEKELKISDESYETESNNMAKNDSLDDICDDLLKLRLTEEEKSKTDGDLNVSCFPTRRKTLRISESSDDLYFSAEEEIYPPEFSQSLEMNQVQKEDKPEKTRLKPDNNVLKFRATCNRVGDHSFTSMEAAAAFGGALNDKFKWTVDLTNFDLNVILNINKDNFYICSGITEKSMHRRNITHFGYVTLRSTMCYNLVRLAEPMKGEIIVDPLCGGGSIPIEGALGFPNTFHICGDNDEKAMNRTWANVNHLKKSDENLMIDAIKWSARKLPLRDASVDVCVTDLPFGKRSGKKSNNLPLYTCVLSEMARVSRCGTARAVLLTHDKKSLTKALSGSNSNYWRQIRTVTVNQGGLFSTVYLLLRTARPFLL